MKRKPFKVIIFFSLLFFSLSGSTSRDTVHTDQLVVVSEISEQTVKEEEPPIVYSVEINEDLPPPPPPPPPTTESTELDSLLYEQRMILDKNLQKADEMGNELDRMIEMLEN